jgi:hypothetical protein
MISINRVRDIGIGTWIMYVAAKVFLFSMSLGSSMDALPDVTMVVVGVPICIILGLVVSILFLLGIWFVTGWVNEVE